MPVMPMPRWSQPNMTRTVRSTPTARWNFTSELMATASKVMSHGHAMFHRVFERSVIRRIIYTCQDEAIWMDGVRWGSSTCSSSYSIRAVIGPRLPITLPCQSAFAALPPRSLFRVSCAVTLARFVSGHYAIIRRQSCPCRLRRLS